MLREATAAWIDPTAIVDTADIGEGTRIWAFTHIMEGASIGSNCNVGDHCFVESGALIGDNVTIKNGNMLWEGIVLEDGVFVGPAVIFTNDRYPRSPRLVEAADRYNSKEWLLPTLVKRGATLGAGAILLPGIVVGEYSMVAAGAVVTRDVPPHALVVGNPNRIRGWVCRCGEPLRFQSGRAACPRCHGEFTEDGNGVRPAGNGNLRRWK